MKYREDVLMSDLCKEIDFLHETLKQVEKERDHYKNEWWKAVEATLKAVDNGLKHVCAGMIVAGTKDTKLAKAIISSTNNEGG